MIQESKIRKLASKLDQEDLAVMGALLQKVASDSANAGARAVATQEEELQKLATDLVAQGFTDQEIVGAVEKIAEHQKTAAECDGITQDILAMGTMMGKQASAVQMETADEVATYIGKKAAAVHIQALHGYVKRAEDESDEDMPPELKKKHEKKESSEYEAGESEEEDEDEKEEEKEAARRRIHLLKAILAGSGLEGAV